MYLYRHVSINSQYNKSTACGTNACLSGTIIIHKILVKNWHNSKAIDFRVMPLVLQLHLVIMSKYSNFGVDTFNTFWVMSYIKDFAQQQR